MLNRFVGWVVLPVGSSAKAMLRRIMNLVKVSDMLASVWLPDCR
jgi:hypothetical protein